MVILMMTINHHTVMDVVVKTHQSNSRPRFWYWQPLPLCFTMDREEIPNANTKQRHLGGLNKSSQTGADGIASRRDKEVNEPPPPLEHTRSIVLLLLRLPSNLNQAWLCHSGASSILPLENSIGWTGAPYVRMVPEPQGAGRRGGEGFIRSRPLRRSHACTSAWRQSTAGRRSCRRTAGSCSRQRPSEALRRRRRRRRPPWGPRRQGPGRPRWRHCGGPSLSPRPVDERSEQHQHQKQDQEKQQDEVGSRAGEGKAAEGGRPEQEQEQGGGEGGSGGAGGFEACGEQ